MRLRFLIVFALLAALVQSCVAAPPVPVKDYLAARKKQRPISIKVAESDPSGSVGKIAEVRGRLVGTSRSDAGATTMIVRAGDQSYLIATDSPPTENSGVELACLVKIGDRSDYALGDLRLVCCAYDVELKRLEDAWQAHAAKAAAKPKPAPAAKASAKSVPAAAVSWDSLLLAYKNAIKGFNRKLTDKQADTIARSIITFSLKYKIDARLVCAVILAESNFRVEATSHCGAMGLGQLMPTTAAGLGVNDAYDPVENIYGSARYIKSMLERTARGKQWNDLTWNDLAVALAAYNAGPGAVKKHGGIPPYRETQNYVRRVTSIYKQLCGVGG